MEWTYDLVGPDDSVEQWRARREPIRGRVHGVLGQE